ncbi:hypothetical protein [uncultured Tenacibaculum sp.]|uniref:hypothetical protein n=1 Tax=uncultured Tenacibaculum sp. TaxID=174713 RepID=UPI00262B1BB0|nr:hypothetical protein [uncultured Tenacibaculum sp.]
MKQNKKTIKTYFETGDKPTQEQFSDLIDSYVDSKQLEGEPNRRFIIDETGEVSVTSEQKTPEYTLSEITGNKLALLKDGATVKEIDLTPYIDDTNLARLVSGAVDTNGLATFTRDDNSTFNVDLSNLKSDLNLQQVTDKGNITTKPLIANGFSSIQPEIEARYDWSGIFLSNNTLNINYEIRDFFQSFRRKNNNFGKHGLTIKPNYSDIVNANSKHILTYPTKTGILATTEDIPQIQAGTNVTIDTTNPLQPIINATGQDGSVTLDTTQTISGQKTFDALLQTKSIQTNGGLSTSGNITAGGRIRAAKNALDFTEENNAGSATIKANIVGSSLHTLQPKSGTIAHLDDIIPVLPTNFYEKGNWPINMLVQGVSITPGNSLTFFERQGNKVNCVVDLRLFDTNEQTNTNNGTFQFDLPFPCINNSAIGNVIEFNSGDGANAVQYTGNLTPDVVNNKLFLVKSLKREYLRPGDAVFHDTSGADSTRIIISFSYLTTVYTP